MLSDVNASNLENETHVKQKFVAHREAAMKF
jgi:hypothetical protein